MQRNGEGWLFFAATILGIAGIMRIFDAIWAFSYHGVINLDGAVLGTKLTTYGWIDLCVAVILILASFGVMMRSQLSRWVGVGAGSLLAISAVWWMPYYPIWSIAYVGLGVLVVYALVQYGGETSGT
jgi:hypothetical protein